MLSCNSSKGITTALKYYPKLNYVDEAAVKIERNGNVISDCHVIPDITCSAMVLRDDNLLLIARDAALSSTTDFVFSNGFERSVGQQRQETTYYKTVFGINVHKWDQKLKTYLASIDRKLLRILYVQKRKPTYRFLVAVRFVCQVVEILAVSVTNDVIEVDDKVVRISDSRFHGRLPSNVIKVTRGEVYVGCFRAIVVFDRYTLRPKTHTQMYPFPIHSRANLTQRVPFLTNGVVLLLVAHCVFGCRALRLEHCHAFAYGMSKFLAVTEFLGYPHYTITSLQRHQLR